MKTTPVKTTTLNVSTVPVQKTESTLTIEKTSTTTIGRDWKYELKSFLRTFLGAFLVFFLPLALSLDFSHTKELFGVSGLVAAVRSFLIILVEPIAIASWKALLSLADKISAKMTAGSSSRDV